MGHILSKHHALISAGIAVGAIVTVMPPMSPVVVLGYAVALGVLVDLDHFLLARLNTGSWRATTTVLRNPRLALFDQASIFETGEVGAVQRLVSHVAITALLVAVLAPVSSYLSALSAAVLVGHIGADIVWDYTPVAGPAHARERGS